MLNLMTLVNKYLQHDSDIFEVSYFWINFCLICHCRMSVSRNRGTAIALNNTFYWLILLEEVTASIYTS